MRSNWRPRYMFIHEYWSIRWLEGESGMSLAKACHYKNKGHGSGSATKTTTDIRRLRRVSPSNPYGLFSTLVDYYTNILLYTLLQHTPLLTLPTYLPTTLNDSP